MACLCNSSFWGKGRSNTLVRTFDHAFLISGLIRISISSYIQIYVYLVGGLEHFLFSHILGIVTPTDEYFSEGLKPPTSIDGKRFGNMKGYTRQGLTHLTISSCNLTPENNSCWMNLGRLGCILPSGRDT